MKSLVILKNIQSTACLKVNSVDWYAVLGMGILLMSGLASVFLIEWLFGTLHRLILNL